jgi:hypothetical protein
MHPASWVSTSSHGATALTASVGHLSPALLDASYGHIKMTLKINHHGHSIFYIYCSFFSAMWLTTVGDLNIMQQILVLKHYTTLRCKTLWFFFFVN